MAINKIGNDSVVNMDQVKEAQADQAKEAALPTPTVPASQPAAPQVKKVERRRTMKSALLRDQLQSRLKSSDPAVQTTWSNFTPSARSNPATGVRTTGGARQALSIDSISATATPAAPVKRAVTFTYDTGDHNELTNLKLQGSWNTATGEYDPQWASGSTIAMKPIGNGKWAATVELLDDGQPHNWEWGVTVDGPTGKGQWAVMGEGNLKFSLDENTNQVSYSPTTYHEMGAHKSGNNDISFKFWAPDAQHVSVKVFDESGRTRLIPMKRDAEGNWTAKVRGGWSRMLGSAYVYQLVGSDGNTVERPDPYARVMQGEQRGIGRTFINLKTGEQTNQFYVDPDVYQQYKDQIEGSDPAVAEAARQHAYALSRAELARFEVVGEPNADSAYLIFKDDTGRQLTRAELLNRLGRFDSSLVDKLHSGKYNDLWSNNVDDQGNIKLINEGGAWTTLVNNLDKLAGLHYELQVYDRDAQGNLRLRGDSDGDGKLTDAERKASVYNDNWSDLISPESGRSFRGSIIADGKFDWQNDAAQREMDHNKWVIYQLHVGSFFGKEGNASRSTFKDVIDKLDYFKSLGVNTLELLPVNEFEGTRDWGYMGDNSLAVESAYGFEDETGHWISGVEGLKRFIDMAHARGLNVINDVVYNHVGGDYNYLWNLDGKENPYFNWSKDPTKFEKRDTPWGAMPAYNNPKVRQFFVDHAVAQVEEFHFDGLRFDFTEPIKGTGGKDGWDMLREINRQLHFYNPNVFTAAEQFDYDPNITRPEKSDDTGGGFDATWYTEFQHRLVHDNGNPSIIEQAAKGQWTNMDQFMNMLTNPRGLDNWSKAVTIISDHDEVGNAERTIAAAEGDTNPPGIPPQWARSAARFAAGIGLAAPGVPMFFEGDESMAQNTFKWGVPSTWDIGWDWESLGKNWDWNNLTFNDDQRRLYNRLFEMPQAERENDAGYQNLSVADRRVFNDLAAMQPPERDQAMLGIARRQMFQFYKEALALRASSRAFEADAQVARVYTHNDNSVMAFTRQYGDDEFLVIGSLNHNNLQSYRMDLPPGQWKEVFDSDAGRYGGNNFGNFGATINGGPAQVNIPAAGYVVFKKI